jgi:ATPase subunit of ABC transporter with duplicated ATPase domains
MVARLNSPPARILSGEDLSPGELRKVMLALGVAAGAQLIIADEPTNHLDLNSIRALETLLHDYPGALLLVSHDAPFLAATCETHWEITADKTTTNSELTIHP